LATIIKQNVRVATIGVRCTRELLRVDKPTANSEAQSKLPTILMGLKGAAAFKAAHARPGETGFTLVRGFHPQLPAKRRFAVGEEVIVLPVILIGSRPNVGQA
jgi:hypothetical protein